MARDWPRVSDPLLALLPKARRRLARTDPVMAKLLKDHPPLDRSVQHKPPFAALVESITHQQVSLASGRAIFARIEAACGGEVAPPTVLALGADGLRGAGLSRPKVAYALDLAQKAATGEVDFARLPGMTDEEIVETLTRVKGIGVWTAKMFLIFHLSRPDVLAHEDLGLQTAVAKAYRVPREKAAAKMQRLAPAWSPYASVVALGLWHYRHVMTAQEKEQRALGRGRSTRKVAD